MEENAYIEKFLSELENRKYSSRSVSTYRYPLRRFVLFLAENGGLSLQDVTPELLEKYRLSLVRSDFTGESLNTYLGTLRKFFAYLEEAGIIFANPAGKLKTPKVKRGIKDVPTPEELERLLSGINITTHKGIRDRAMIETAYCALLGVNEDAENHHIQVGLSDNRTLRVHGKGEKRAG